MCSSKFARREFEDIAKKYSDVPLRAQGAISTLQTGALAKELEDKTFAMKAGDIPT